MAETGTNVRDHAGYHSLVTVMDTRACLVILLDPRRVHQLDGAEALGDADVPHLLAYLEPSPNWGRVGPRAGRPEHSRPRARQKPDH